MRRSVFLVLVLSLAALAAAPPTLAQPAAVDRPAALHGGTCDSLGAVVV